MFVSAVILPIEIHYGFWVKRCQNARVRLDKWRCGVIFFYSLVFAQTGFAVSVVSTTNSTAMSNEISVFSRSLTMKSSTNKVKYAAALCVLMRYERIIEAKCAEKAYSYARRDSGSNATNEMNRADIKLLRFSIEYLLSDWSDTRLDCVDSMINQETANAKIGAEIIYNRRYDDILLNMTDRELYSYLCLLSYSKKMMCDEFFNIMRESEFAQKKGIIER